MIHSKKCFKCNAIKLLSEFYKHPAMLDGHLNKCKDCTKKDVLEHRSKNIEKIRAYDRERGKLPHRIKLSIEVTKAWRQEDLRRSRCHSIVAREIKKGDLLKQNCVVCNDAKSVAHHEDYDKPLDVVWFCNPCHKQRHKVINKILGKKKPRINGAKYQGDKQS